MILYCVFCETFFNRHTSRIIERCETQDKAIINYVDNIITQNCPIRQRLRVE